MYIMSLLTNLFIKMLNAIDYTIEIEENRFDIKIILIYIIMLQEILDLIIWTILNHVKKINLFFFYLIYVYIYIYKHD